MPNAVVSAYYAKVNGATVNSLLRQWTFPCDAKLPDITVVIAGRHIVVPGININYQTAGINQCFGGLQNAAANMPLIFGDVFLKNLFVVHELPTTGSPRLGFAQSA